MSLARGEGGKPASPFLPDGSINPDFGREFGKPETVIEGLMNALDRSTPQGVAEIISSEARREIGEPPFGAVLEDADETQP